jgi:plasmid stabilization system protein ParE
MVRLVWSRRALQDLVRLDKLLSEKDAEAASRALRAIRGAIARLATHPEAGRPLEEMPPEHREWPVPFGDGAYLVLYRYDGEQVVILAVRHGKEAGY